MKEQGDYQCASHEDGLEDGLRVGLGSLEDLVGELGHEREKGAVFIGVEGLDEDKQSAGQGQALEAAAALIEDTAADAELDVGVVEVVEEIEDEDRIALGADIGEEVEELVAGEGTGEAGTVEHLVHGRGAASDGLDERVSGEPFAACDGVEGAAQGELGEELGQAVGRAAMSLDEQQAGAWAGWGECMGEDLGKCVHAPKIRRKRRSGG